MATRVKKILFTLTIYILTKYYLQYLVIVRAAFAGNIPTISGADLLASYTFVELCFRWSLQNNEGSEHMLNYRKFPLELQAMHRTGPPGERTSSYDLLMIAYFFEVSLEYFYWQTILNSFNSNHYLFYVL